MDRKKLIISSIIILLASVTVIIIVLPNSTSKKDIVYLSLNKEIYDKKEKELTINIHNETKEQYVYGVRYDFQIYKNDMWNTVAYADKSFNPYFADIGLILKPNSVKQEKLRLDLYDIIPGQYRYIKKIGTKEQIVRFIIK